LDETILYRTLASTSRIQILKLLQRGSLSVEEISQKLNLQAITIRHHLQALAEAGIVECHEERSGTAGRPRAYYNMVKTFPSTSFPKRLYQSLSEHLISGMVEEFGVDKTKIFLRKIGIASGEATIRELESKHNIKSWSLDDYKKYLIEEFLEREGNEPEIIETTNNKIVYRLHNCLFRELSAKMPAIMCDVLHESFHEGVSKAIGKGVKITRSTCMGHGDQYCEHVCVWGRQARATRVG
jgi:predicted ArsR family transcriptional regulator